MYRHRPHGTRNQAVHEAVIQPRSADNFNAAFLRRSGRRGRASWRWPVFSKKSLALKVGASAGRTTETGTSGNSREGAEHSQKQKLGILCFQEELKNDFGIKPCKPVLGSKRTGVLCPETSDELIC